MGLGSRRGGVHQELVPDLRACGVEGLCADRGAGGVAAGIATHRAARRGQFTPAIGAVQSATRKVLSRR